MLSASAGLKKAHMTKNAGFYIVSLVGKVLLKGKNLDNPKKILEELELIKDGKLTTAAVLLFHKQPSRIISGAKVEIGKMRNEGDVVNKEEC